VKTAATLNLDEGRGSAERNEIGYRWATTAAGDQTRGRRGAATIPVINANAATARP
jgi:hypothetical protein